MSFLRSAAAVVEGDDVEPVKQILAERLRSTSFFRFLLVALMTRTFTPGCARPHPFEPASCKNRSSLTCMVLEISATSSRNTVRRRPIRNGLSCRGWHPKRAFDMAEKFGFDQPFGERAAVDGTNGAPARRLSLWMALATSSFPVPVSGNVNREIVAGNIPDLF